ncbi:E3 ubiquitin-protein ligase [Armadillidium vulgare]|nr:E3 ubiquitin-protein ligase [Armadillidium vulgare]
METSKYLEDIDQESLTLVDVTCPICLSIMIQPITMPCHHSLCSPCFESNVSQSNLACPMCRKRISIWVRKMNKCKKLINEDLWLKIQNKFKNEVDARINGKDDENNSFTCTLPPVKVAAPGEIREEYEEEVRRLREEEEAHRQREEAASKSVIQALQENEERELSGLIEQRELLSERDFEFAKQLRSSQISETLSCIRSNKRNAKDCVANSIIKGTVGMSSSPSAASIDFYLEHVTPERKSTAPMTPPSSHDSHLKCSIRNASNNENLGNPSPKVKRSPQRELCTEVKVAPFFSVTSTPTSEAAASSSSRIFKDITSHYSSESEPEFDSEENVPRMEDISFKEFKKAKKKCDFADTEIAKSLVNSDSPNTEEEANNNTPLMLLSEAFDENNQNRNVDRSKGSEDEYSLRNQKRTFKKSSSGSHSKQRTPDSSKKNKLRQTTLMESLTKKQRRV